MRVALGIEYDGSQFSGWQLQAGANTIQQAVEQAISAVADTPVRVHAAGRTDTGVHATEQVIHFDCDAQRESRAWVMGVNTHLPGSISVLWAKTMQEGFHARHSAVSRQYRYVILNRPTRPAILDKQVTWIFQALDAARMRQAASCLVGTHDFTAFRATACQSRSPVRTVHRLGVQRQGEFIWIDVLADGFLHHMVRNIAGALIAIGKGEQEISWTRVILESRDRASGGITAPAAGLYLVKVQYDVRYGLHPAVKWPAIGIDCS